MERHDAQNTAVLMTYAEIDIRNHIYKQMIIRDIPVKKHEDVTSKYFEVISQIYEKGFQIVNGPFGSGLGVPSHGNLQEKSNSYFN